MAVELSDSEAHSLLQSIRTIKALSGLVSVSPISEINPEMLSDSVRIIYENCRRVAPIIAKFDA